MRKKRPAAHREVLIATLGGEPQVVTRMLDRLLLNGHAIEKVVIVHTSDARIKEAVDTLRAEFEGYYRGKVVSCFKPIKRSDGEVLDDFRDESDLDGLNDVLYNEIRTYRRSGYLVQVGISGGRKVMGITAMVMAQLLFGEGDGLWHLVTEGWQPGGERRLHPIPGENTFLIQVPVLRWSEMAALLGTVAEIESKDVRWWFERIEKAAEKRTLWRHFVEHDLSPAELAIVRHTCKGLDNKQIANLLYKSPQTVANQLNSVYSKLSLEMFGEEREVDRGVMMAELGPYFYFDDEPESEIGR